MSDDPIKDAFDTLLYAVENADEHASNHGWGSISWDVVYDIASDFCDVYENAQQPPAEVPEWAGSLGKRLCGELSHHFGDQDPDDSAISEFLMMARPYVVDVAPTATITAATPADAEVLRAAQRVDGVTAFVFEAVAGHEERSVMRALSRATISGPSDNTPTAAITALRAVVDCAEDSVFGEEFESCENGCDCCICGARKVLAE